MRRCPDADARPCPDREDPDRAPENDRRQSGEGERTYPRFPSSERRSVGGAAGGRAGREGGNRQNQRSSAFAPNPDPREFVRLALRALPPVPGCRHSRSGGVELIGREIIPADEAQPSWVRLIVRDIQRGRMHRQRPEKQKSSSVLTKIAPDARSGGMIPARAMALGLDLRL